jgi:hypothetical protein
MKFNIASTKGADVLDRRNVQKRNLCGITTYPFFMHSTPHHGQAHRFAHQTNARRGHYIDAMTVGEAGFIAKDALFKFILGYHSTVCNGGPLENASVSNGRH